MQTRVSGSSNQTREMKISFAMYLGLLMEMVASAMEIV